MVLLNLNLKFLIMLILEVLILNLIVWDQNFTILLIFKVNFLFLLKIIYFKSFLEFRTPEFKCSSKVENQEPFYMNDIAILSTKAEYYSGGGLSGCKAM
jgi:hypothetical protein